MQTSDLYRAYTATDAVSMRAEEPDEETPTGRTLYGHFARFGVWNEIRSPIEGHFMERIASDAFDESFARFTPKPIFDHGHDPELGMKPLGTVRVLRADGAGPYYEVDVFESVPDLVTDGLRAGMYGASYRFSLDDYDRDDDPGESDHNPTGLPEVTIVRATVKEFGPTAFGADPAATAQMRSLTDRFVQPAAAEVRHGLGIQEDETNQAAIQAAAERSAVLRALTLKEL